MTYVLAGALKGMRLAVPPRIRPTESKVRLALFNVLQSVTAGAHVLDGCAGSGALGLEALSRGAASAAFLDRDPVCLRAIRMNLERAAAKGLRVPTQLLRADLVRGLRRLARRRARFDLILLDPPYGDDVGKKALNTVAECAMLPRTGVLCLEHGERSVVPSAVGCLHLAKQHRYGGTVLSFYETSN
jgi:16S rRNA (guanine(966)-N(2))-methyltransferase RsmD